MSSFPSSLEVGTTIGDYQIVSVIGRGGMGKVFKVRNVLSDP
jgi:serine/threonine protein kinase